MRTDPDSLAIPGVLIFLARKSRNLEQITFSIGARSAEKKNTAHRETQGGMQGRNRRGCKVRLSFLVAV